MSRTREAFHVCFVPSWLDPYVEERLHFVYMWHLVSRYQFWPLYRFKTFPAISWTVVFVVSCVCMPCWLSLLGNFTNTTSSNNSWPEVHQPEEQLLRVQHYIIQTSTEDVLNFPLTLTARERTSLSSEERKVRRVLTWSQLQCCPTLLPASFPPKIHIICCNKKEVRVICDFKLGYSVSVVTTQWAGRPGFDSQQTQRKFYHRYHVENGGKAAGAWSSSLIVPWIRMHGAMPPFTYTSLWRGTKLAQGEFSSLPVLPLWA